MTIYKNRDGQGVADIGIRDSQRLMLLDVLPAGNSPT